MDDHEVAALFDAYADRLFRYCWFVLRSTDAATIAVRDTLIAAAAHRAELTDPAVLASWLYALARSECRHYRPVPPAEADEPPARPSQPDADSRVMAWNAVTGLDPAAAEVLELACRHDVDLGLVLGVSAVQARALLDRAQEELADALGAEIVVSQGSQACPVRAQIMRGWAGSMTAELRGRVLRHAARCSVCEPDLPRNVSAGRVFALLPTVAPPAGARSRVLAVAAATRGAPAMPRSAPPLHTVAQRRRVLAAVAAASASAAVACFIVLGTIAQPRGPVGGAGPPVGGSGAITQGQQGAGALPAPADPARPVRALRSAPRLTPSRAASTTVTLFTTLTNPLPGRSHQGASPVLPVPPRLPRVRVSPPKPSPSAHGTLLAWPGGVNLGAGSWGQIVLTAAGATQHWSAVTSSSQLSLSGYGGMLRAGQSVTLTVHVERTGLEAGSAVIFIDQGSPAAQSVMVSWAGRRLARPVRSPWPPRRHRPPPGAAPTPSQPSPVSVGWLPPGYGSPWLGEQARRDPGGSASALQWRP